MSEGIFYFHYFPLISSEIDTVSLIFIIFEAKSDKTAEMTKTSPEEVMKSICADFKFRGETHESAAIKMGYNCKQTLSNLLTAKKYLTGYQAKKFKDTFGYNMDYLMFGEGELLPKTIENDRVHLIHMLPELFPDDNINIGQTVRAELNLILSWIHTLLRKQDNKEGLELLTEIYHYAQARDVVKQRMKYYQGDSYDEEFLRQLLALQSQIIDNVDLMLNTITVRQTKEDSQ